MRSYTHFVKCVVRFSCIETYTIYNLQMLYLFNVAIPLKA